MKEHLSEDIDRGLRVKASVCEVELRTCQRVNRYDIQYGETPKRMDVVQIGVIGQSRNSHPESQHEASSLQ